MIEIIFITAFVVLFVYECTRKGMIFQAVAERLKPLPDFIKKPLYDCPICMIPYWGSVIVFLGNINDLWSVTNWFEWVSILFAAAGVNTVLNYLVEQGKAVSRSLNESDCNCTKKETKDETSEQRLQRIAEWKGPDKLSIID